MSEHDLLNHALGLTGEARVRKVAELLIRMFPGDHLGLWVVSPADGIARFMSNGTPGEISTVLRDLLERLPPTDLVH